MNIPRSVACFFTLLIVSTIVSAAGSSSSSTRSTEPSEYDQAVELVNAGDYGRALRMLERVVEKEPGNADAWNYIGYSHRNMKQLDKALEAYNKALALNPKHKGAREYLGELYLMKGDVAKAEEQLKELDRICFFGCEEYDELKAAIEKHKQG